MTGMLSVSRQDLLKRRRKLRRHRQMKILTAVWRILATSSITGGMFWIILGPVWVITTPGQILMRSGNQLLPQKTVQRLLQFSYPQSLWRIRPAAIAQSLERQPIIAQAIVNRRLFPPGLNIEIQERLPVAMIQPSSKSNTTNCVSNSQVPSKKVTSPAIPCLQSPKGDDINLIDASGNLIPWEKYTAFNPQGKLPALKVLGSPEQYQPYWVVVYQAIQDNSLNVMEIDFRDPTNVIFKTELGTVHLGIPVVQLDQKIQRLREMSNLKAKFKSGEIVYIDLRSPDYPLVQLHQ
ncbi:FtsQ-type POTRA domain-containing protein [Cylindrospermopsis raciborskii]|uniref:cell division protein FtsQ/DivIB n=1 Tax=Cylindrospermopsis raciborskii TaxID=77022 RepID=UPI0022CA93BA|nr:FtsQ-type POTRA domain-containing protein [Cylindrospermopsis raciborskii]MCZ2200545.1 FtsQ-type POTRA domain-containing protein [Cylindrospermopsis raciborskii PAMP2012]MCZ2206357.1 FtsQ-type POTRA domain-containing protein [Cylindrospermopsis raciborskii PAMP2011]